MTGSAPHDSRLRVLFVSNLFPDKAEPYRGLDNATVLKALQTWSGCEVRVVSPRPWLPIRRKTCWKPRVEDVSMAPLYVPTWYVPKLGSHFNHHLMRWTLERSLRDVRRGYRWDVVLASWLYPDGWAAVEASRRHGAPAVLIAQGSDVHKYLSMPARKPAVLEAVNGASAVITRSRSLATLLGKAGADAAKLHPITNGIDTRVFNLNDRGMAKQKLGVPGDTRVLLYVGNLLDVKNPLMLVRCFAKLAGELKGGPLQLVMVGKGPLEQAVSAEARALGVEPQVRLMGPLHPGEVAEWMKAADLLCMTSRNEGLPNVILEAQACGLPVVGTDVGSTAEIVDEEWKGGVAPPGDVEAWVELARRQLEAPAQTLRIAEVGMSRTWRATAESYFRVLCQSVGAKGRQ